METTFTPENQQGSSAIVLNNASLNLPIEYRTQIANKIVELKAKFNIKKVFVVIVEGKADDDEKPYYIAYLRRPNLMQFSQYMTFVQKDLVQANQMLARNIFLDGDKELIDDEELFLYGTMNQLNHVIDARNSDIVKKIERCKIEKEDYFRQRLALTTHYYPQLNWENMSDDDFAFWSENAQWVHSQMLMVQQANSLSLLGGGKR